MSEQHLVELEFLLGEWKLNYRFPASDLSPAEGTGTGQGTFKKMLDDRFLRFEYTCSTTLGAGAAVGIFAWDAQASYFRYFWFENSGAFATARCRMEDRDTLFMEWEHERLVQTFHRDDTDRITLLMDQVKADGSRHNVLEVRFSRM